MAQLITSPKPPHPIDPRWSRILAGYPGTMAAAIAFPFVMLVILSPLLVYGTFASGDWTILPAMLLGCFVMALFCMLLSSLVGALCFGAVISFDCAFGRCIPERTLSIVAGGMTGFVGGGGLAVLDEPYWLLFVVPALIAGQIGASRGYDSAFDHPFWDQPVVWWRFDIRRILIATTWFAVVCAIVRLLPYGVKIGISSFAIWLVLQTITLYCGRWIMSIWRYSRGKRSTVA